MTILARKWHGLKRARKTHDAQGSAFCSDCGAGFYEGPTSVAP